MLGGHVAVRPTGPVAGSGGSRTVTRMDKRFYTIKEAAERLGCPWTTLRDKVTRGTVPHHRLHGVTGVRFTEADLEAIEAMTAVPVGTRYRHQPNLAPTDGEALAADLARFAGLRSARIR